MYASMKDNTLRQEVKALIVSWWLVTTDCGDMIAISEISQLIFEPCEA